MKTELRRANGDLIAESDTLTLRELAEKHKAYLRGADLRGAYLRGAYLRGAYLKGADLEGACLKEANLWWADLRRATGLPPIIAPDGDVVVWKKADGVIVKLLIPANSKRLSATTRKCRAERAVDLGHETLDGKPLPDDHEAITNGSGAGIRTVYRKGLTIEADGWTEDRWVECGHGIHFWLTREEAVAW